MKQVEQLFLDQCKRGAFPGGQLVVQRGSERLLDIATGIASGHRGEESKRVPVTPETRFQVMSASKAVLARCVALLEARGKLDVNASVSRYIPEFCAPNVTLLDVLTHRSGVTMPHLSAHPELWSDWGNIVSALRDEPPAFHCGTLAYQPIAFGWILSEVLQRVTGETLSDFSRRELDPGLEWLTKRDGERLLGRGIGRDLGIGFGGTQIRRGKWDGVGGPLGKGRASRAGRSWAAERRSCRGCGHACPAQWTGSVEGAGCRSETASGLG